MKKLIKWISVVVAAPVVLFIVLAALLYVPVIQNFIVSKVAQYASQKTHLQIHIDNIHLAFPLDLLVNGVQVTNAQRDTLLIAKQVRADVQLLPLFRKQIEIDGIGLKDARVNSLNLIPTLELKGTLQEFYLSSHGVALDPEVAVVTHALLRNTHLEMTLRDTVVQDTTPAKPVYWKILVRQIQCQDVSFLLHTTDSTRMNISVGNLALKGGEVDLKHSAYRVRTATLQGGAFAMDNDTLPPAAGLDAAHLAIQDCHARLDSLYYQGRRMAGVVSQFSAKERSGLEVTSLKARFKSDNKAIRLPMLELETPDSYLRTQAYMDWDALEEKHPGNLTLRLLAQLGKQDVMTLCGGMPKSFVRDYPNQPITLRAAVDGNKKSIRLTGLQAELKSAFKFDAKGEVKHPLDSLKRKGRITLQAETDELGFLRNLIDSTGHSPVFIPKGMTLDGEALVSGNHYKGTLGLEQGEGRIDLLADCRMDTRQYEASLTVDSFNIHHFLPADSIYYLHLNAQVKGRGFDPYSHLTHMDGHITLDRLQYAGYDLSGLFVKTLYNKGKGQLIIDSDNDLLKMRTVLDAALTRRCLAANLNVAVSKISLKEMRLTAYPLDLEGNFSLDMQTDFRKTHSAKAALEHMVIHTEKTDIATKNLYLDAHLTPDSTCMEMKAGDLNVHVDGRQYIDRILHSFTRLGQEFVAQAKNKWLDQNKLKTLLPELCVRVKSGRDNPIYNFLAMKGFKYDEMFLDLDTSPLEGVTADAHLYALRRDSLVLDTLRMTVRQDSLGLKTFSEVRNAPTNKQFVFDATLNTFLHPRGAGAELNFFNAKGEQGVHLGLGVDMADDGLRFKLYPEQPTIAFHKFTLNKDNYVYWHKNGRVEADVKLDEAQGMSLHLYSVPDSTALQDLTVSLSRINLGEMMSVLPYLPDIKGIWSADLHYIQTADNLSVAVETSVDSLSYENAPIGNVGCSGIYLPKENNTHYVDTRFTLNDKEVAALSGDYHNDEQGALDMVLALTDFPLMVASGFIPDQMAALQGQLNGDLAVKGNTAAPNVNGQLSLDSVTVMAEAYGARFRMDNRPVTITDSKMVFNDFSVYTRSNNPFKMSGTVDFSNLKSTQLDLRMVADNYELINAPRKKNSLLYGKVYVDVFSTLRGDLDNLKMRGNINVLGTTDVTYVLKDSPLTVEDRLSGLVTFVNFADTAQTNIDKQTVYNAGGVDVLMSLRISEGAQARVDLSADRESYISLNGGGNLSMQYTPQGEFILSGRYTVNSGSMKYALPIIPLKTFNLKTGSYVEFTGNPMNPRMNIAATERLRTTVTENNVPRSVDFEVGVAITNTLENMGLEFTMEAPEDAGVQNQLVTLSKEERGKLAVAMLATGMYLGEGGGNTKTAGGFNANNALNSFLQSEISNIAGSALKTMDISFGMEDATSSDGSQHTDYSFRFAKRFWNNRISIVIGGRISTGNSDPTSANESFIDDISLEWRLDDSGTRYIRLFHNTNFDSMLEGEIIETGAGIVLRKKMDKLGELFIFRRKRTPSIPYKEPSTK